MPSERGGVVVPVFDVNNKDRDIGHPSNIIDVRLAHFNLMSAYINAISVASLSTQWKRARTEPQEQGNSKESGYGPLVQWLVGNHVRSRLEELAIIYRQLQETTRTKSSDADIQWLTKAREGCIAVSSDLPRLRLPGFIALGTFAIGVATALVKLPGWVGHIFEGLAASLIVGSIFAYIILASAYKAKRSIFLHGARYLDKQGADQQKTALGDNIYRIEDDLFRVLLRGKKPETELDKIYIRAVAAFILGAISVALFLGLSDRIGFPVALACLLVARYLERRTKSRIWL